MRSLPSEFPSLQTSVADIRATSGDPGRRTAAASSVSSRAFGVTHVRATAMGCRSRVRAPANYVTAHADNHNEWGVGFDNRPGRRPEAFCAADSHVRFHANRRPRLHIKFFSSPPIAPRPTLKTPKTPSPVGRFRRPTGLTRPASSPCDSTFQQSRGDACPL
jgi:hypothetical protein